MNNRWMLKWRTKRIPRSAKIMGQLAVGDFWVENPQDRIRDEALVEDVTDGVDVDRPAITIFRPLGKSLLLTIKELQHCRRAIGIVA